VGRRLRRHHRHTATALRQHAQDVALDTEVIGHDMETRLLLHAEAGFAIGPLQRPLGLRPRIRRLDRDDAGQVQAGHGRRLPGGRDRPVDGGLVDCRTRRQGQDAAVLGTLAAQVARESAGIEVGDRHRALGQQVLGQRGLAAEIGCCQRQVLDDQAGGLHTVRFGILAAGAIVADVRVRQGDDLLAITGVGQDFLVAGHRGVEDNFANAGAGGANGISDMDRAVCERQDGGGMDSLERQEHWVLRMGYG